MCPSYMVTREEKHSTRGRAHLLFEMLQGDRPDASAGESAEVRDALDLCLACKGCKGTARSTSTWPRTRPSSSPTITGPARPAAHYSMGWLPALAQIASPAPGRSTPSARLPSCATPLTGGGWHRPAPPGAAVRPPDPASLAHACLIPAPQGCPRGEGRAEPGPFTNHLTPAVGQAAVEVLEAAGCGWIVPDQALCCGLTWISTGQLATARRVLQRTVDALALRTCSAPAPRSSGWSRAAPRYSGPTPAS